MLGSRLFCTRPHSNDITENTWIFGPLFPVLWKQKYYKSDLDYPLDDANENMANQRSSFSDRDINHCLLRAVKMVNGQRNQQ